MILWLSEHNMYAAQVVYEIETTKADIKQIEYDLLRLKEKVRLIELQIDAMEENLNFLRTKAEIVSIREYQNIIFQLSGLYQERIEKRKAIPSIEKQLKILNTKVTDLEVKKEQVRFKVLKFKR